MTPHEETSPQGPAPAKRAQPRRSRRGGRGRRRPAARPPDETAKPLPELEARTSKLERPGSEPTAAQAEWPDPPHDQAAPESAPVEEREAEPPHDPRDERETDLRPSNFQARPSNQRREFKPAAPAAVAEAIEEVNVIITSLKQVLDQMEEILETLELAEAQKTVDEREIQSLRSALRQLDRRGPGARQEQSRNMEREGSDERGPEPRRRGER